MQPVGQFLGSVVGCFIGCCVGPFSEGWLDEALGLSVCLWRIGFGSDVLEAALFAGVTPGEGFVAGTVVDHDPLDGDAEAGVPGDCGFQERP